MYVNNKSTTTKRHLGNWLVYHYLWQSQDLPFPTHISILIIIWQESSYGQCTVGHFLKKNCCLMWTSILNMSPFPLSGTRMSKLTKNVKRISSANVTNLFQSGQLPSSCFFVDFFNFLKKYTWNKDSQCFIIKLWILTFWFLKDRGLALSHSDIVGSNIGQAWYLHCCSRLKEVWGVKISGSSW